MANKRLVVNADDYGLCGSVNVAIEDCISAGVVTSTSCLVYRWPSKVPRRLLDRTGVHLRLSDGPSVAGLKGVPSFKRSPDLTYLSSVEIGEEFNAQFKRYCDENGRPTHLDGHHHVHANISALPEFISLANAAQLPVIGVNAVHIAMLKAAGLRCNDAFVMGVMNLDAVEDAFTEHDTVVVAVHPGYIDDELRAKSSMVEERRRELGVLLSKFFDVWLARNNVELIGAGGL